MKEKSNIKYQKSNISIYIKFLYYLLFFFVPLIMYSGTSELFEFNKMLFIYVMATLVGTLWISDIILNKRAFRHSPILSIVLLLFLASQILSTIFSIDVHTSLFGYYGRFNGGLFSIIAYMILFYAFIQYFNARSLKYLLIVSLVSSFFVILWGLPGKFGYDLSCQVFTGKLNNNCWTDQFRPAERMFSTLGQPNWLGEYLAIHFFIAMYFWIQSYRRNSTIVPVLLLVYFFLNFSAILFTRSRSTLVAVFVGLLLVPISLIFITGRYRKRTEIIQLFIFIIGIVIFSTIYFQTGIKKIDDIVMYIPRQIWHNKISEVKKKSVPDRAAAQPLAGSGVTDSLDIRKIVWKGAIDLGNRYKPFGTGVETFAYAYYFVRPVEHNLTSEWDFLYNKAHNEFLNYFATTGYVGLISYLLMIGAVFYIGIMYIVKLHEHALLISCLLLAYITIHVTNFFGFSTTSINVFFFLIPGFIYVLYHPADGDITPVQRASPLRKILLLMPVGVLFYIIIFLSRYFTGDLQYNTAEGYTRASEYQKAAETYSELLKTHYEHVYEDKLSYVLANLAYIAAYQKDKKTASSLIKLAQYYNQHALSQSRMNINYWKTSVKNDYLFYQTDLNTEYIVDGLNRLHDARKISPTDPKLPYSEALFYSVLEDDEKNQDKKEELQQESLQAIDEAIKLKSDYRDSYFLKGQLLKKYGRDEEAKKVFQFILDHLNPADEEVKKEIEKL